MSEPTIDTGQARADRVIGQRFGRYEGVLRLASGGMGQVIIARVAAGGDVRRHFAIKLVHEHLRTDPQLTALFRREASIASRLHHPNVVPVLELDESDKELFLVMDFFPSAAMSQLQMDLARASARVSPGVAASWISDIASGLHAFHELKREDGAHAGLVHRDVTPSNVLVGVDGSVKLADFGVARDFLDGNDKLTRANEIRGKVAYLSPEQVTGEKLDRRCDVWALGVVLWELLAGRRLFRGEENDDATVLYNILHGDVPDLSKELPDCPASLATVIAKALTKNRNDRYQSALELADALSEFVDGPALRERTRVAERFVAPVVDALNKRIRQNEETLAHNPPMIEHTPSSSLSAVARVGGMAPKNPWRGPLIAGAVLALAGLVFLLTREVPRTPTVEAAAVPAQLPVAPPAVPVLPEPLPVEVPVVEAATVETVREEPIQRRQRRARATQAAATGSTTESPPPSMQYLGL